MDDPISRAEFEELKESVKKIDANVDGLKEAVAGLTVTLKALKELIKQTMGNQASTCKLLHGRVDKDFEAIKSAHTSHEDRISNLEKNVWKIIGAATLAAAVSGVIIKLIWG